MSLRLEKEKKRKVKEKVRKWMKRSKNKRIQYWRVKHL